MIQVIRVIFEGGRLRKPSKKIAKEDKLEVEPKTSRSDNLFNQNGQANQAVNSKLNSQFPPAFRAFFCS